MSSNSNGDDPLAQFQIKKIKELEFNLGGFNIDLSITNSSLYMIIATLIICLFMFISTRKLSILPNKLQIVGESFYLFIKNMIQNAIGDEGEKFFPLIFSLFMFIVMCNIMGMTPYGFTATSQVAVTLSLALIAFLVIIIFAIYRNGIRGFFRMFLPSGVPLFMRPLIFMIVFFSFLIRPITLSVRLFANMVAGHVLLKVIAGFVVTLGLAGIFPLLFAVIMTGFELFVAILQAYIFCILVSAYLAEVTKTH